jgi:hypothetical protein
MQSKEVSQFPKSTFVFLLSKIKKQNELLKEDYSFTP